MTVIQQVLFELDGSYLGHPYFVTGNALFNAIAQRVDARTRRALHVSHGVFVPGEYGEYPDAHSQNGYAGKLGQSLPPVEAYDDLFVFRDAAQRWLLESRPRDAHNTHDIERHGDRLAFAPKCYFGRPAEQRNSKRSVQWFVHCYLHGGRGDDVGVPVSDSVLEGIRVGGARNYGFGRLSLSDAQVVDLDALDYSRLTDAESGAYVLELVSPYVLSSECPGADDQSVPWWWDASSKTEPPMVEAGSVSGTVSTDGRRDDGLRRRETRFIDGGETYRVETVDHGQVVGYAGDDVMETARNGMLRVGTHSKYGFGEFRVRPAGEDRVSEREAADTGGET